ncbi:MAG: DUF2079 domain-containing protein, partial [Candidatus Micrarchaeaceae archaeon]
MNQNIISKKKLIFALKLNINKIEGFVEHFKKDPFLIIIIFLFLFFTLYWSYISIMKFYALDATIWDLGLAMNKAWTFMQHPLGLYSNMIVIVIFPIFIPQSYPLILAFQAMFITFGIFPLYWIGKHILKSNVAALFIAMSYLFYPYLIGDYWFDFHYQALFPTLFFLGYFFYIKNELKKSFIFIILSGLTRSLYLLFSILFSIVILIENLYKRKIDKNNFDRKNLRFAIFLAVISLLLFLLFNYYALLNLESGNSILMQSHINVNLSPFNFIDNKIFVLLLVTLPFLGLPFLSKRFIIFFFPYFYILFFSNSGIYLFPGFTHFQYGPLIYPFLYLATIDSLSHIFKKCNKTKRLEKMSKSLKVIISNPKLKFSATIFVLVILLATVYQPYGPIDEYSQAGTNLSWITDVNMTTFNNLEHIVNMIPKNDPYVMTQDNIPEIYPRTLLYEYTPITPLSYFFTNITVDNHYMRVASGHIYNVRIDYVLADIENPYYWQESPESMYNFTKLFYGSGEYGILAEAYPIVLLERNYTGPILYYVPFSENFKYNEFNFGPLTKTNNNYLYAQNISKYVTVWYGPATYLGPGEYNITFQLETSNNSLANTLNLDVSANSGQTILASQNINGSNFTMENKWTNITLNINVSNFIQNVEFRGFSSHWNGTIALKGVYVKQVAPSSRSQEFVELKKMMSLIPDNSTVIAENNMPDPIPELLTSDHIIQLDQINITMPQY